MRAGRISRGSGFTLVELVMVILVMGILALGSVSYIRSSGELYQQAAEGEELGSGARLLISRLTREIRSALPNSLRTTDGRCLEFIPLVAGGRSLPASSANLSVMPLFEDPGVPLGRLRVAIYPIDDSAIYAAGGASDVVSPPLSTAVSALAVAPASVASASPVDLDFTDDSYRFAESSPRQRWFLVANPVSFCLQGGRLYRYQDQAAADGEDYGLEDIAPTAAVPPPLTQPETGRWLVAENVFPPSACGASGDPFQVADATLSRNALVRLDFCLLGDTSGELPLVHEIQVRNVP